MEDSKKDERLEKKMKYVQPELISLDKSKGAEGGQPQGCEPTGSSNANYCANGPGGDPKPN